MNFPINLDKNENQYGPAPRCYEVLNNVTMEMLNSYSRNYPKRIKEKLSEKFNIDTNRILLGYGSEDILKQTIYFAIKKKGDVLVVPDKSWWYYKSIGIDVGANVIEYNMVEKDDCFDYNEMQILDILKNKKPKAIILCTPNNPTGNILSKKSLERIIKNANEAVVILDEAYWGFNHFMFGEEIVKKYDNVIVLRTFSKFYSLAGIRIGFAFIGKNLFQLQMHNNRYLGYNRISEELIFSALESDDYYKENNKKIMQDVQMFFDELTALGFKPYKSNANFILAKLPEKEFKLLEIELPKKEVLIKFFKEDVFKNCIRISIGTQEQNQYLIELIKFVLNKKN